MSGPAGPEPPQKPPVVFWFKMYAGLLFVTYLLCVALAIVLFSLEPADLEMEPIEVQLYAWLLLIMGLVLSGACLVALVVPPRPWTWIYDLVVICVGFTSVCCMPMSIPLLIFWLKPQTKAYFGRT